MTTTVHRACTLCEANCGLSLDVENNRIIGVRGDPDDVLSAGFICPKGAAIGELHHDPDRLRRPMIRDGSGQLVEASWDDALDRAAQGLAQVRARHGADAVACYIGNPVIHNHGALLLRKALMTALGTRNSYSAGSRTRAHGLPRRTTCTGVPSSCQSPISTGRISFYALAPTP